jgi:hypothetical protein
MQRRLARISTGPRCDNDEFRQATQLTQDFFAVRRRCHFLQYKRRPNLVQSLPIPLQRIWVMDRGIPTEDVLAEMRADWPDPGRYALPLVLPLVYFAGATIDQSARNPEACSALPANCRVANCGV